MFSYRRLFKSQWIERQILLGVLKVVGHPWIALVIASVLLLASGVTAVRRLNVSSDQDKLFSPNVPFFRDYLEFDQKFPENDALYVVIQAAENPAAVSNPSRPRQPLSSRIPLHRWTAAADAVVRRIREVPSKYVESIDAHIPLDQLGRQSLLFAPQAALNEQLETIDQFGDLARLWGEKNPSLKRLPARLSPFLMRQPPSGRFLAVLSLQPQPEALPLVSMIAQRWTHTLANPQAPIQVGATVPDLAELNAATPQDLGYYWLVDSTDPNARAHPDQAEHLLTVRVFPHVNYDTLSAVEEPVSAIRAAVKLAAKDFPELRFGTTGRPALDADEMATTNRDSTIAEIIAAVAVFIGLWLILRSLWLALAAEIALGFGIGWTFGWATVSIGELNLLSIVFLIALIGIGMDYLVQVLTRYRTEARRHERPKAIWARVFRHVSAPINTACFGAAGAFLVSYLTHFRGAAELGVIAGGGLLLCLFAGYTVLPALLTVFPPRLTVDVSRRPTGQPPPPKGMRRLLLPAAWVGIICCLLGYSTKAHFDPNLLDLQAPKLESTQLIRKLQTWSSVVLTKDLSMLSRVRTVVEKLPVVQETESILNAQDNYRWLAEHQGQVPRINWSTPAPIQPDQAATLANQAGALADLLDHLPAAASSEAREQRQQAIQSLRDFAAQAAQTPAPLSAQRLSAWQEAFVGELQEMFARFSPGPLDLSKVPAELRNHLVSADGTYALYINPKPEMDLWDRHQLQRFVTQVEQAVATVPGHPPVTGIAPNIYYTTREVRKCFVQATTYALILIVILVLIDLQNIRHTLLAISVLGLGLPLLLELMGLLKLNWNFANFFALPILIGAGHEYGVFMIHRYREVLRDPRRSWRFWDVSDRALLLCAYITTSSFGFFWAISQHRGLRSLGLVMALGTACIYLSTIMVLRPLLLWRLERRSDKEKKNIPIGPASADELLPEPRSLNRIR